MTSPAPDTIYQLKRHHRTQSMSGRLHIQDLRKARPIYGFR